MSDTGPTLFDAVDDSGDRNRETTIGPQTPQGNLQSADGLLALMALPGVGSGRALKIARAFVSTEAFNDASDAERKRAAGIALDGKVHVQPIEPADEGVRIVGYFDEGFPLALREIKDAPAVLWVRGSLPDPARRMAVVGTRSATDWGLSMARAVASDAAAAGVSVVSGLALGIDIAAHRAALAIGGHTTAILGSGIDRPSPREHLEDAEAILESGGCLLTEQPPGAQPSARTLVARNRLQSGLSAAIVVVQCGLKSGTMSTARYAIAQGKTLAISEPSSPAERVHSENQGSLSLLSRSPKPRVLSTRDDLTALLSEIS